MDVDSNIENALKDFHSYTEKKIFNRAYDNARKSLENVKLRRDIEDNIHHDANDLSCTVRVTFPQAGKPYLRSEVLESLADQGMTSADLKAIGPLNDNSRWQLSLTSKDAVSTALSSTVNIRGNVARMFSLTSRVVQMRLHWLPIFIPTSVVTVYLCQFGQVKSVSWDKTKVPVLSSVRNVVVELDEGTEVPHIDSVKYEGETYKLLITIPGRGPICFRCNKTGHTRAECQEVWCRHCYAYTGHLSEECASKNRYASAAKGNAEGSKKPQEKQGDLPEEVHQTKRSKFGEGTSEESGKTVACYQEDTASEEDLQAKREAILKKRNAKKDKEKEKKEKKKKAKAVKPGKEVYSAKAGGRDSVRDVKNGAMGTQPMEDDSLFSSQCLTCLRRRIHMRSRTVS